MIESRAAVVTSEQAGERLDVAATRLFPELSRKKIKTIIDSGGAYVNKKRILFAKHPVSPGDKIELFWERVKEDQSGEGQIKKFAKVAEKSKLQEENILLETNDFIAINKPAGIPSQATLTTSTDTILHALNSFDAKRFPLQKLFLVHRLDKETSGVMLIAKTPAARNYFETAFKERKVEKVYEALTFNIPKVPEGKITFPIAKDPGRPNTYYPVMRTGVGGRKGAEKEAETDYIVKTRFNRARAAHIECYPHTGRTHQIRVHLMAIGCPLIGDKTYANNILGHSLSQVALRHMLHAKRIKFRAPDRKEHIIEAPWPDDFLSCFEHIQKIDNPTSSI